MKISSNPEIEGAFPTRSCCEAECSAANHLKWEQGLSVPDSDMLITMSEVLETPVSTLLGETIIETEVDTLKAISENWK